MDILTKDFIHLPGAQLETDGLHITPVDFAIVNQDGSGGQPNPPVNLYGVHAQAKGDFKVSADLRGLNAPASFSLYGQPPIIYDEFRYERSTLEFTFDAATLRVQRWLNNNQTPTTTSYALGTDTKDRQLDVIREGQSIRIVVDDKEVTRLREQGQFTDNEVWFGASATQKPWTLTRLALDRINNAPLTIVNTADLHIDTNPQGLQQLLTQHNKRGFQLGAAVALSPLVSDPTYAETVLNGNFGAITTENALKWQFVHPAPDVYSFEEADALVSLSNRYHIAVHGHTLVFGEANPAWVTNLPTANRADKQHVEDIMTNHVKTVVQHFAGKIASWDVVNEALSDYDEFESGQYIRNSIWSRAMGADYIAKAFHAARAADPSAKLFINEFGLEEDGERWDYFLKLVTDLKRQGVPIDGVGFQAHVYERSDKIDPVVLRRHIQQLAAIGLVSRISEIDVYSDDGPEIQAKQYSQILRACLQEPSCIAYTTWGVSDRYNMFRDDDGSLQAGQDFLWDTRVQPTRAVEALRGVVTSQ